MTRPLCPFYGFSWPENGSHLFDKGDNRCALDLDVENICAKRIAMPRRRTEALNLDKVHAQFEDWRRNRKGRAAIPDELWLSAIQVARREGVNRTAATLHLDGGKLKRRMLAAGAGSGKGRLPEFVELLAQVSPASRNASSNWRAGMENCASIGTALQPLMWLA